MSCDKSVVPREIDQVVLASELRAIAEKTSVPYVVVQDVANAMRSFVGAGDEPVSIDIQKEPESKKSTVDNPEKRASEKKQSFLSGTSFRLEIAGDGRVLLIILAAMVLVGIFAVI